MKKENAASGAVAMANGMRLVEEFADNKGAAIVYAITRDEWYNLNGG